jgi:glycerol kinase
MRNRLVLAIDQGTTNTKVLLMSHSGEVVARAARPLAVRFPQPGWVEQDARALSHSVLEAMDECLAQAPGAEIAAIGITNQRESVVAWDRDTGAPIGPCITWQCRRTAPFCSEMCARGFDSLVRARTGLAIDPLFSASKIRWLLTHARESGHGADPGKLCAGTVDSWLLWNLTGGAVHATDPSNASRTQLLNLGQVQWDTDLLDLFEVPAACLPRIQPSSGVFGHTISLGKLPAGVPIAGMIGDSHAALFGHAAFEPGTVKATYGTGSSLMTMTNAPVHSHHGLSTTIAWAQGGKVLYALEGNIINTGGAIQWLGEFLGLRDAARETAALAESVDDTGGVYVVPAFAGLGAPHWDPGARGLISGLTRGSTAAHVARATLDAVAYQVRDVFEAMQLDAQTELPSLLADGGASCNDRLMQFQADIIGRPVIRSSSADLSACGAAWLAGLAVGFWSSLAEIRLLPQCGERFNPDLAESRRAQLLAGWHDALKRALSTYGAN